MISRRTVLQTSAAFGVAATAAAVLPGLRAVAQASVPLRRSLHEMDLDDPVLAAFRTFVATMKDPDRDGTPVSWVGFANVHGSLSGFNLCPHGNWYFLPWHRGYVRMYEMAVRSITGYEEFAMPYWDWTAHPDFPAAFGDQTFNGQPNPLYVEGRLTATGDRIPTSVSGPDVMDQIYAKTNYEEFGSSRPRGQDDLDPRWITAGGTQGELEFNPHNNIHCLIRGPFMCNGASPQDPIFQMHHGNIDRIWAEWIAQGRNNSDNSLWLDMPFTDNYIDPDGNLYTQAVRDMLEVEPLGYTYGIGAPQAPAPIPDPARNLYLAALYGAPTALEAVGPQRVLAVNEQVATPENPLSIRLDPNTRLLQSAVALDTAETVRTAGLTERRVYAFIRQLEPADQVNTQLRVFANLPEVSGDTDISVPNYVTTIGFFGPTGRHGDHDMRPTVAVDLTPTLRRLERESGLETDELSVQLVPVPQVGDDPGAAGNVAVSEVELAIV
ncbi:MAG: polyphenol oxidase [Alphaproteobacteria bacterium]|jgi:tyrosinase|nr:polyphenol oxidase [Alphaproteobacteria bacterium]